MVQLAFSRNGNWDFKHNGKVYVFREKYEGEQVLVLDSGKWVRAGRVTRGVVFLGEEMSSDEYYRTLQGIKAVQEALQSFLASKGR